MKVLFFNCVYRPGHLFFDSKLLGFLSSVTNKLIVLQPANWFNIENINISYIDCELRQNKKTKLKRLSTWIRSATNVIRALPKISNEKPDCVVVGEYELSIFSFVFPLLLMRCKKIILVQHNNIDQLTNSKIKRMLFSLYKNKVYHCVLEPFIKDYIVGEYNIIDSRIFCWPYPIGETTDDPRMNTCKQYNIIGLSQSNDENQIEELIKLEEEQKVFEKNKLRVLLKSKRNEYDDGYLKVLKGWICDEDYQRYYNSANSVLVAFPPSYQFRVSATLIEAFAKHLPVIGADIMLINYYHKAYPDICMIYNSKTFVDELKNCTKNTEDMNREFKDFSVAHSDDYILTQIKKDLEGLM